MATAEEIQRNALAVLATAVRTTPAGQKVDPNQLLFALDASGWGKVEAGGLLEMQSVHAALLERGVLPSDAALVCLLFQRREQNKRHDGRDDRRPPEIGIPFEQVVQLAEDER